jgi:hypothetical protein
MTEPSSVGWPSSAYRVQRVVLPVEPPVVGVRHDRGLGKELPLAVERRAEADALVQVDGLVGVRRRGNVVVVVQERSAAVDLERPAGMHAQLAGRLVREVRGVRVVGVGGLVFRALVHHALVELHAEERVREHDETAAEAEVRELVEIAEPGREVLRELVVRVQIERDVRTGQCDLDPRDRPGG